MRELNTTKSHWDLFFISWVFLRPNLYFDIRTTSFFVSCFMWWDWNFTFYYLVLCLCLLFPKQDAFPWLSCGDLGKEMGKRVQTPSRGLGIPPALSWQPGQGPPVTSANLAFSSSWKGENVATTEVADTVGLVNFVQEVNVYGVSVPGTHRIF